MPIEAEPTSEKPIEEVVVADSDKTGATNQTEQPSIELATPVKSTSSLKNDSDGAENKSADIENPDTKNVTKDAI